MAMIHRRTFLEASAGVAAGLAVTSGLRASEAPPPPLVPLGDTGIQVSRLAMGTGVRGGNRQSNQTRMGFEKFVALFHHAYERGIRFFDLADLYGTHVYFREALRTIPREDVAILTKIWWPYDGPRDETDKPHRAEIVRSTLERFQHELNTDYLDVVLLHCLLSPDWQKDMQPYMDELSAAKERGQVRAVGVSCHDFGAMAAAAEAPWVDVILARINSQQVAMDGPPERVTDVLRTAQRNKKAVIGMKIFGEGRLIGDREGCIRFAQELGVLDAMTIGFEKPGQIDEVLQLMAKYPAAAMG
jgi:aryl-alcohol dehydrogenase-like predicted oxidoreductase